MEKRNFWCMGLAVLEACAWPGSVGRTNSALATNAEAPAVAMTRRSCGPRGRAWNRKSGRWRPAVSEESEICGWAANLYICAHGKQCSRFQNGTARQLELAGLQLGRDFHGQLDVCVWAFLAVGTVLPKADSELKQTLPRFLRVTDMCCHFSLARFCPLSARFSWMWAFSCCNNVWSQDRWTMASTTRRHEPWSMTRLRSS